MRRAIGLAGNTALLCLAGSLTARAQPVVNGHVSLLADHLPNAHATELRARVYAETKLAAGDHVTFLLSGFADGLIADRDRIRRAAILRPQDVFVDVRGARTDLRAGFARLVWGRLDEIQPGDVVNPIDVSRFFLEGRSEARLPVALVRSRWFLPRDVVLEGVLVPVFRRGRFDQLDEASSPFNVLNPRELCRDTLCPAVTFQRREPEFAASNVQGGARVSATTKRVDWAVSAYRGFRTFGVLEGMLVQVSPPAGVVAPPQLRITEQYPRFTMLAADVETARGPWGVRGEAAFFVRDRLQTPGGFGGISGQSVDAGLGADRKSGAYRWSASAVLRRRAPDTGPAATNVLLVGGGERSFARETRTVRVFGVYDSDARATFLRAVAGFSPRDNWTLELSGGWFTSRASATSVVSTSLLSGFADRDFAYVRLRYHF